MPGGISLNDLEEDAAKRKMRKDSMSRSSGSMLREKRVIATRSSRRRKSLNNNHDEETALEMFPESTPGELQYPGAVSVSHRQVSSHSLDTPDETVDSFQDNLLSDDTLDMQSSEEKPAPLVNAILVDDGIGGSDPLQNIVPYVEAAIAIEDKPWRRRLGVFFLMVVVVGITVGISVPLTKRGNDSEDDSTYTPTQSPTTTPAPTSMGLTTVVIQLDDKPEETGWKLDCGSNNVANFPTGVYQGRENRLVTEQFPIVIGQECTFTISDSGGNGLYGGFYRMHFGQVFNTAATQLLEGSGNFTDEAQGTFFLLPPPTEEPTASPTLSPSISPAPTLAPSERLDIETPPPNQPPTIFPPTSTPPPECSGTECNQNPPSLAPTTELVQVKVVIQLDEFPSETGWTLQCGSVLHADVAPMTHGDPFELIQETFEVENGSLCIFAIVDSFHDGICCQLERPGYYKLFLGQEENLVAEGGEFTTQDIVEFTAS